jgi:hypothetical protein
LSKALVGLETSVLPCMPLAYTFEHIITEDAFEPSADTQHFSYTQRISALLSVASKQVAKPGCQQTGDQAWLP